MHCFDLTANSKMSTLVNNLWHQNNKQKSTRQVLNAVEHLASAAREKTRAELVELITLLLEQVAGGTFRSLKSQIFLPF